MLWDGIVGGAPSPDTITLIRASTYEFWGWEQTSSSKHSLTEKLTLAPYHQADNMEMNKSICFQTILMGSFPFSPFYSNLIQWERNFLKQFMN